MRGTVIGCAPSILENDSFYTRISNFVQSPMLSATRETREKETKKKRWGKKTGNTNNNDNKNNIKIRDNTQHHMILMTQIIINLQDLPPLPTYKNSTSRQHSTSYIHYLHTNASLQNHIHASRVRVHCGSAFESGAYGLPYYCTPPVCIPASDEIGALFN